jgi:hypothetical protein
LLGLQGYDNKRTIKNEIYLKLETNTNESEETIIGLLNYETISDDLKNKIILKNKNLITDISQVTHTYLWHILLENNKIVINWNNLLQYYKIHSFDNYLVNYLDSESNYKLLSQSKINKEFKDDDDLVKEFCRELIKSKINIDSLKDLNSSLIYEYGNAKSFFTEVSEEKIKFLVYKKRIILSVENYKFIEDEFEDILINLIEGNVSQFFTGIKKYTLNSSISLRILKSDKFTLDQKLITINNVAEAIIIDDKNLSKEVCFILSKSNKIEISLDLLQNLLLQGKSHEDKIRLFNKYFDLIGKRELENTMLKIGKPYSEIITGINPKIENNEYNLAFYNNIVGSLGISSIKQVKFSNLISLNRKKKMI